MSKFRGVVSQPDVCVITHEYVGKDGSNRMAHSQAFNLLIVDAGIGGKRVEYSVFEELGERLLSEVLDSLVSTE